MKPTKKFSFIGEEIIEHDSSSKSVRLTSDYTTAGHNIPLAELNALEKVFSKMCYFSEKNEIKEKLHAIDKRLAEISLHEEQEPKSNISGPKRNSVVSQRYDNESEQEKLDLLYRNFQRELGLIGERKMQRIKLEDIMAVLKTLEKKMSRQEVEDMIWEVDEKLDHVVDYDEFLIMYDRNRNDTTGLEPSSFFLVVQFLMFDQDENFKVSLDEAMNIILPRSGPEEMQKFISKLFGSDDGEVKEQGHHGGEIPFSHYWKVVTAERRKMFDESDLGRKMSEKSKH